jgi:hypothetical protein
LILEGVNQWVPTEKGSWPNENPILNESDKLGLSYSVNLAEKAVEDDVADNKDTPHSILRTYSLPLIKARITSLKTEVFGGGADINLPIELMLGSTTPVVSVIKPDQVPQSQPVAIAFTGSNLQNIIVDATKIKVVTGTATIVTTQPSDNPSLVNGQINLKINVTQDPVVLQLQSIFNDPVYTPPITLDPKTIKKSAPPFVPSLIAPNIVELESDKGQFIAKTVTVIIAGDNLDQVDLSSTGIVAKQGINPIALSGVKLTGGAIQVTLTVSSADNPVVFTISPKDPAKQAPVNITLPVIPTRPKQLF